MTARHWTEDELNRLRWLVMAGYTDREIAADIACTEAEVRAKRSGR